MTWKTWGKRLPWLLMTLGGCGGVSAGERGSSGLSGTDGGGARVGGEDASPSAGGGASLGGGPTGGGGTSLGGAPAGGGGTSLGGAPAGGGGATSGGAPAGGGGATSGQPSCQKLAATTFAGVPVSDPSCGVGCGCARCSTELSYVLQDPSLTALFGCYQREGCTSCGACAPELAAVGGELSSHKIPVTVLMSCLASAGCAATCGATRDAGSDATTDATAP